MLSSRPPDAYAIGRERRIGSSGGPTLPRCGIAYCSGSAAPGTTSPQTSSSSVGER
jgi:hypothetical protein